MSPSSIAALRDKLFTYLREHPSNYSGAAKHVGLSRDDVMEFLSYHKDELAGLENEFLDQLEEYVYLASIGQKVPKEFRMPTAISILKRKRPEMWKEERVTRSARDMPYALGMSPIVQDILGGERVEYEDANIEIVRFADEERSAVKTVFS
jgi:hypothetical protein